MDSKQIEEIYSQTFGGLAFFYRDTTLSENLISKYRVGQILTERGFTDMSFIGVSLTTNLQEINFDELTNDINRIMITVKVTYTVKPEFVEANKQNINKFLDDFKKMNSSEFRYNVYLQEDERTFLHLSTYKNEEIQKQILNVESFKSFQEERDKSGLNHTHKVEILTYVGSSFDPL